MRFTVFAVAASALAGAALADSTRKYSTVPGYFLQDDSTTDPATFDPVRPHARVAVLTRLTDLDHYELRPQAHRQQTTRPNRLASLRVAGSGPERRRQQLDELQGDLHGAPWRRMA
jgi:hypothetical protein